MEQHIILNRIKTPDGTILTSHHRHDYVTYTDKNGQYYSVDGGTIYLRRGYDVKDYEELSVSVDENTPHDVIRENFHWGRNYDADMNRLSETEWVALKDLTTPHIEAIIKTQKLEDRIKNYFKNELEYREEYF